MRETLTIFKTTIKRSIQIQIRTVIQATGLLPKEKEANRKALKPPKLLGGPNKTLEQKRNGTVETER